MSDLVPPEDIEQLVGVSRRPDHHYARSVSAEGTVYVLHSQQCLDSGIDLRDCAYSRALDRGIEDRFAWHYWSDQQDRPVKVWVFLGRLLPDFR